MSYSEDIKQLKEKIGAAEANQSRWKEINSIIRKHKKELATGDTHFCIINLEAVGLTSGTATKLLVPDFCGRIGIPDYQLTNNNANIRRMKERLQSIEKTHTTPERSEERENARLEDCPAENRIRLFF